MIICPCCGFKSESILRADAGEGCQSCGARAVGEPLPKPEHELPAIGRSLLLVVTGSLFVLALLTETILALFKKLSFDEGLLAAGSALFKSWIFVAAAETAAWRLKWVAIPMALLVFFGSRKLYQSVKEAPLSFCGLKYARRGYLASAAVPLMILVLIGVTVPERMRHRREGIEAGNKALGYQTDRVLLEYKAKFDTYPSEMKDLKRLPDPDGSIANLLQNIEASGYKASAEVAAVPTKKPRPLRGAVISKASLDIDDSPNESLSFTNYELRLPGYDKLLNTEDDVLIRDGVVARTSDPSRRPGTTAAAGTVKP